MSERSFQHALYGKGKGCGIYSTSSKIINRIEKHIEEKYQLLSIVDVDLNVQLVLVYCSSDCPFPELVVKELLLPEVYNIITGDFNFDRSEVNDLTRYVTESKLVQLVNSPTHNGGRTIDHCYVPEDIKDKVKLKQYSPYYSDHDALCINLN